jgi:hypothetical protein
VSMKAILRAYGLWLLGVLSAAAAAWFLYRSRLVSYELADEADGYGDPGIADRIADYSGDAGESFEDLSAGFE